MKVTVGISFYNSEATLEYAIRSVLAQSFTDWELLLIDDGSTDRSLEIARAVDDPRVRVVSDGKNCWPAARLNQIADMANGEYVARMDADDIMHPSRLEMQVKWLDERPHVDLVDTAMYTIDSHNVPVGVRGLQRLIVSPHRALAQGLLNQPTILGRTAWMRKYRYDTSYQRAEDHELWARSVANCHARFERLTVPLLFYREDGSISTQKVLSSYANERRTMRRYGPRLVGVPATLGCVAQSYLKSVAWWAAGACRLSALIYGLRSEPLSDEDRDEANRALQIVLRTPLAGVDVGRPSDCRQREICA